MHEQSDLLSQCGTTTVCPFRELPLSNKKGCYTLESIAVTIVVGTVVSGCKPGTKLEQQSRVS
eukprot:2691734-Amphidinium_carterae.1